MQQGRFLASFGASLLMVASPGQAASGRAQADISLYEYMTRGLTTYLVAAFTPGDFHNRTNVRRFLREFNSPLNGMQVAKIQIQNDLRGMAVPCTISASTRGAVDQLERNRGELRRLLERLGRAVRPTNSDQQMTILSQRMAELYAEKSWVPQVAQFCSMTGPQRRQLLLDIRASKEALGRAYESLAALSDRLSGAA